MVHGARAGNGRFRPVGMYTGLYGALWPGQRSILVFRFVASRGFLAGVRGFSRFQLVSVSDCVSLCGACRRRKIHPQQQRTRRKGSRERRARGDGSGGATVTAGRNSSGGDAGEGGRRPGRDSGGDRRQIVRGEACFPVGRRMLGTWGGDRSGEGYRGRKRGAGFKRGIWEGRRGRAIGRAVCYTYCISDVIQWARASNMRY